MPHPQQGQGNMTIRLLWNEQVDLDLRVKEPNNPNTIYYDNRVGAGRLSHDNTQGGAGAFEEYTGPVGTYTVQVHFFGDHRQGGGGAVECMVIAQRGGQIVGQQRIRLSPGQTSPPMVFSEATPGFSGTPLNFLGPTQGGTDIRN